MGVRPTDWQLFGRSSGLHVAPDVRRNCLRNHRQVERNNTIPAIPVGVKYLNLVGGWATPLKNMNVNWDDEIPNIWENKKWQPNHQPVNHRTGFIRIHRTDNKPQATPNK